MIGRLVGRVIAEEPTGALLLDVRGVGYELSCPIGTTARASHAGKPDSEEVILFVHTNLRQDSLELYGFCAPEERVAFRQLVSVPNVGPRLALAVLNVLPAQELALVIDKEDKARLSKVPGIGKKTAERLVLELRGKLPLGPATSSSSTRSEPSSEGDLPQRLVAALTSLGYRTAEAEKATKSLLTPSRTEQSLSVPLREALDFLAP